jgi:hypothetical protein
MLSHRIEREMEYLAKTTLPLNSIGIIHSLPIFHQLSIGIIFTLLSHTKGEKVKGLVFHSQVSVFGDSCQRGRKYEPKAKGPHHHQFQKFVVFQFVLKNFLIFKLVSYFLI